MNITSWGRGGQERTVKQPAVNPFAFFLFVFLLWDSFPVFSQEISQDTAFSSTSDANPLDAADFAGNMAARGNYLTVKVAVAGPGDALYVWWGHIGILVEDTLSGQNRFYDWGVFSFDTENFYLDFAKGRLYYSCTVSPAEGAFRRFAAENRDLTLYTLDLPPEVKAELLFFAENNVLPENRNYLYHHFKDNCATRVRDIIDNAVGGQFTDTFKTAPGRFTIREHVRRHTWFSPFWDWALNFLMGRDIDRPSTVWEEMFLPSEIGRRIEGFRYVDSGGMERNLVSAVETPSRAQGRPGVLETPRNPWKGKLFFGLALAACFLCLRIAAKEKPAVGKPAVREICRKALYLGEAALGLFFGSLGLVLFFMTFFTGHDYTWHNTNVIFVNPLLLAAAPLGIRAAFRKNGAGNTGGTGNTDDGKKTRLPGPERLLAFLWTYVLLGGILAGLLSLVPGLYQENQPTLALVLPAALVLSIVLPIRDLI